MPVTYAQRSTKKNRSAFLLDVELGVLHSRVGIFIRLDPFTLEQRANKESVPNEFSTVSTFSEITYIKLVT